MMFTLLPEYIGQVWPLFMWGVVIVAAIGCCMGFKEFVWFMSVGYGFAVMCIGAYLLILGLIKGYLTPARGVSPWPPASCAPCSSSTATGWGAIS